VLEIKRSPRATRPHVASTPTPKRNGKPTRIAKSNTPKNDNDDLQEGVSASEPAARLVGGAGGLLVGGCLETPGAPEPAFPDVRPGIVTFKSEFSWGPPICDCWFGSADPAPWRTTAAAIQNNVSCRMASELLIPNPMPSGRIDTHAETQRSRGAKAPERAGLNGPEARPSEPTHASATHACIKQEIAHLAAAGWGAAVTPAAALCC